ncbi:MAG: LamG-like jellyroll fold domain-containing protein [Isosphaeraceae bacterium]
MTFADGLGSQGGAIANDGNLTITDSAFNNNVAQDNPSLEPTLDSAGGAIINRKGATLIVTGTTFLGNEAKGVATSQNDGNAYGGAIENVAGATFNGTNDTFYGNSAVGGAGGEGFGGAVDNAGTASLVDSTVEENSIANGTGTPATPSAGAGLNNQAGATSAIISTILSYNHGGDNLANASSGTVTGPEIVGLPVTNPAGSTITLTGYPSGAGETAGAGANNVWTISTGTGQEVVAASNLVFNGSNSISLPSGLISSATNLGVDVSFSTTGEGVILGYQDGPLGTTPTDSMPALYVGTDGYLHGGIAGYGLFQSTAPVNDGKTHDVVLAINGSTMTVTIDGTQVAGISGSNTAGGMTYDQLGTGFGRSAPAAPAGGLFPFTGTISTLTITQGTALAGTIATDASSVDQIRFTPPAVGNYTVGLSSTSSGGSITSTSQTLSATDVAPTPTIVGLPATGAVNQAYNLTGAVTDPVSSDTAAGFNDVWTASAGTGQQAVAASNLVFNGSNPIALPSGLIHDATSLEISLTFQTTSDGVLLSYQDQPLAGAVPTSYVPMLYIGTNGHLYFEFYNGSGQPIESATALNDGQQHTVTIQWDGSTLSYTLDAQTSGTIAGFTPQMADMTYDALGTGYSANDPNAPSGNFPFTGTINNLSITSGTTLLDALKPGLGAGSQASFTPLVSGTYTIGLSSTNILGHTGTASQTFSTVATIPAPAITNLPSSSPEETSITLTASATESNATVAAEGFSYLWQATDANGASATGTGALSFNGTSQFVDLGNPADLNFSGTITLDAWVLPESTGGLQDIIAHGYQTSPNNAEDFLRINGGYYQVGSWNGNDAVAQAAIPASDIGHWVNLAGVYDGSQWILYRDGVQVGSSAPTSQGALAVSSTDWTLGAGVNGSQRFFQGEIADAGIWNTGLSPAAVAGLMAASPAAGNPGLVAYYPFNEAGGNTAIDATGNGNNGTLGGIGSNNPAADPTRVPGIVVGPNVTLTPGESGTETVALQAFDAAGGSGVTTATFTSSPIPIIIDGGGNAVVQQGTLLTRTCTFTDLPGDGPWTVSILFGDGTPLQSQVVDTPAFTISHVFENAGTFLTIVTVTNRNGYSSSFTYTATVSGFTVNDGSPRPEPVRKLIYTFNNPTEIRPKAFELLRDGKPSHVHLRFSPQPDGQTYLITFSGHDVIDGALPAGHYKLITHHKRVHVVSGAPMTANDVNTFVSVSVGRHDHKKDHGTLRKLPHEGKAPHRKAPPKFPGRTVHHPGAVQPTSPSQHPLGAIVVKAPDRQSAVPTGVLALKARRHR